MFAFQSSCRTHCHCSGSLSKGMQLGDLGLTPALFSLQLDQHLCSHYAVGRLGNGTMQLDRHKESRTRSRPLRNRLKTRHTKDLDFV